MLQAYRQHVAERAALGIPPLPLDAKQTAELIELIKGAPAGQVTEESAFLLDLLTHRVPPGVDDAAKVKASFLAAVAHGDLAVKLVSKAKATELLGTMVGGYNVHPLIELLDDAEVAAIAAEGLKKTLLMFDYFNDVAEKAKAGNAKANATPADAAIPRIARPAARPKTDRPRARGAGFDGTGCCADRNRFLRKSRIIAWAGTHRRDAPDRGCRAATARGGA